MKKFGTPIGAGPGSAKEKVGFEAEGTPPLPRMRPVWLPDDAFFLALPGFLCLVWFWAGALALWVDCFCFFDGPVGVGGALVVVVVCFGFDDFGVVVVVVVVVLEVDVVPGAVVVVVVVVVAVLVVRRAALGLARDRALDRERDRRQRRAGRDVDGEVQRSARGERHSDDAGVG